MSIVAPASHKRKQPAASATTLGVAGPLHVFWLNSPRLSLTATFGPLNHDLHVFVPRLHARLYHSSPHSYYSTTLQLDKNHHQPATQSGTEFDPIHAQVVKEGDGESFISLLVRQIAHGQDVNMNLAIAVPTETVGEVSAILDLPIAQPGNKRGCPA